MELKRSCIVCGHPIGDEVLFTSDNMPASAQDIPDESTVKSDKGIRLTLCRCRHCGLVQFDCTPVAYYKDVIRAVGSTATMTKLRRSQYQHLIDTYHLQGKKFIEVGCGTGDFLQILTEYPVKAYGMEHKKDSVEAAQARGLSVFQNFADAESGEWENGPYDVFLSFNFLEHQPNPNEMLQSIYRNLTPDGMGLITVPSFEYILENDGYYELIRDHIAYYTFDSLQYLLEKNGFEIVERTVVNRDTLSVIVRKHRPVSYAGLADSQRTINATVDGLIQELKSRFGEGYSLAVWGAGHQGFTLIATTKLKECAKYIVDSAPFKQGRFAPASHVPILPPDALEKEPVDSVLIVAPGYTDEIRNIIRKKFGTVMCIMAIRSSRIEIL